MHAVITGASSGIGEAAAREFARHGYKLTLVARRTDLLQSISETLGVETNIVTADLLDLENCTNWIDHAIQQLGNIDVFINNAGIEFIEKTVNVSNEQAEKLMTLNLLTPMRLINYILPKMLERASGTIVNISSVAGINPTPNMYHYSASKAALGAASESLHAELKGSGVHIITVYPGPVATPMEIRARAKLKSVMANSLPSGTPEKLAALIFNAVKNKEQRIIYPAFYTIARNFSPLSQWITNTFTPKLK